MSMTAKSPTIDANTIEREIVARLRAAKLRPRFDKVALPLVSELKAALASVVPEGQSVVFTISAPIGLPAKTAAALANMARSSPRDAERRAIVHGAAVRIRRLGYVPKSMLKVLGFVHSVESDASVILAVAEARLIEPNGDKQRRTGRTTLEEGCQPRPSKNSFIFAKKPELSG
jgi:hypothetical protein